MRQKREAQNTFYVLSLLDEEEVLFGDPLWNFA